MYTITVDIETTGLDIAKDVPIQLAYNVHREDKAITQSSFYIYPEENFLPLSPVITELTGITQEVLRDQGVSPHYATALWHTLIWDHQPCELIGYNLINFDFPMIQNWLNRYHPGRFKHPPITRLTDVMFLVGIALKSRKWIKLGDAARRLGTDFKKEELHEALADAKLTHQIYKKVRESEK